MVWLKALVIAMGVLIVAGFSLVVVTIAGRMSDGRGDEAAGFGTIGLHLAESCRIASSTLDGERLVLHLAGPAKDGCAGVVVVDLAAGRVLGRVAPGAPAAEAP